MSYKIYWKDTGLICEFEKDYTNEDQLNSNQEIYKDSRLSSIEYGILDFNLVTSFPINTSVIREIAYMDAKLYKINPTLKLALVANQTVMKGLINMYKTYAEIANDDITWDTQCFESLAQAETWVQIKRVELKGSESNDNY